MALQGRFFDVWKSGVVPSAYFSNVSKYVLLTLNYLNYMAKLIYSFAINLCSPPIA